jgi:2-amino-4-hydroxy-6-hydroxymethyldihydropteridine diphosphokinase
MIILGLGANLESDQGTGPAASLDLACERFEALGFEVQARSPWFESAPVPASDQPWFVNGVVGVSTLLGPGEMLSKIKGLEAWFGRRDETRWAARPMDIDILDYQNQVLPDVASWPEGSEAERSALVLPHPRLHLRRFVLAPLEKVAPDWRHPVFHKTAAQLLAALDDDPSTVRVLQSEST